MNKTVSYKEYGQAPFQIFLVHGGPGAIGDMQPVAEYLSDHYGIVETFHKGLTINAQLEELFNALVENNCQKATLIGHSWGAWLTYMFASKYPEMVRKLILIGSAPFEASYAETIMENRFERLNDDEKRQFVEITSKLDDPLTPPPASKLKQLRKLLMKADSYKLLDEFMEYSGYLNYEVFRNVWFNAEKMRKEGILIEIAEKIECKVVAIHGDYDPHVSVGVEMPLSEVIGDFHFIELEKCGHYPWFEKFAKEKFYQVLINEINK